jgi:hypothetical protein
LEVAFGEFRRLANAKYRTMTLFASSLSRLLRHVVFRAWALHTVLVFATSAVAVYYSAHRDDVRPPAHGLSKFVVNPLTLWDGGWFLNIAENGYADRNATAFWPLWPLLVRFVSEVFRIPLELAGVLTANALFLAALAVLHRLVSESYSPTTASRTVWLLALSPVSFFFSALYSESLFLLLMVGAVLCARHERWWLASLALFLAASTRSVGMLLALPLVIIAVQTYGRDLRRLLKPFAGLAAAGLGPLLFAVHLDRRWDDPLLMVRAQENWSRSFSWPWDTMWSGFRRTELIYINARHTCLDVRGVTSWEACRDAMGIRINSLNDDLATFSMVIALTLLVVVGRKLLVSDLALLGVLMLFPLFTQITDDPFGSMPRYLLVMYPLFICAAFLLGRRWLYLSVLILSAIGCIWMTSVFTRAWFVA